MTRSDVKKKHQDTWYDNISLNKGIILGSTNDIVKRACVVN